MPHGQSRVAVPAPAIHGTAVRLGPAHEVLPLGTLSSLLEALVGQAARASLTPPPGRLLPHLSSLAVRMPQHRTDALRLTGPDRDHVACAGTAWASNFGFEFLLETPPAPADLNAALAVVCEQTPRMRARVRGDRWQPGPAPRAEIHEGSGLDLDLLRSDFVDKHFDPAVDPPVRVHLSGRRVSIACMHGGCDAAGLVGFASDVFSTLVGLPTHQATSKVRPLLRRSAWRPDVVRELPRLRLRSGNHVTPFPARTPPAPESEASVWSLSPDETESALESAGSAGPTGIAAAAVFARCLEDAPRGAEATMFVPVNLRSTTQRWWPVGNHIGYLLVHHSGTVSPGQYSREVRSRSGPAGYAARWEQVLGAARRALGRRSTPPPSPDLSSPPISVSVNNLGRIDPAVLPGVEEMVFVGSNSPLYPVVTLQTVGRRMTVCARVRRHHGGRRVADELIQIIRDAYGLGATAARA